MIRIAYVGDLIIGDQPIKFGYGTESLNRGDYHALFSHVRPLLQAQDLVVANFESVIRELPHGEKQSVFNWSMCCADPIAEALGDAGINIVSVANNHTMDHGLEWFEHTVKTLRNAGLAVIGVKDQPFEVVEMNGRRVAFIGVSYLKVKQSDVGYLLQPDVEELTRIFASLGPVDHKVVIAHWGNEFIQKVTQDQVAALKDLARFQPDAIIGHHSHVLQDAMIHEGTPVFLSLGNFVSDYWQDRARRTEILLQEIGDGISWNSIPCLINAMSAPVPQEAAFEKCPVEQPLEIVTADEIQKARWKLRREYLHEVLKNFHKIRNKPEMFRWLLKRMVYLATNFRNEKKNPSVIYEKY